MPLTLTILLIAAAVYLARRLIPEPKETRARRAAETRRVVAQIRGLVQPALVLQAATERRASRLGGEPSLPPGTAWPTGPDGQLGFLAQFDLGEVHSAGGPEWLPREGRLLVFHDERWGFRDQVRIVHTPDCPGGSLSTPEEVPPRWRYPERAVAFERRSSLPGLDWLGIAPGTVEGAGPAWAEIAELADKRPAPRPHHQIGGYPSEIQPAWMPVIAEVTDRTGETLNFDAPHQLDVERSTAWRLLLQIDSDDALGMNWGDAGMFYILVREQDARAADFSRTVTIWQTY